MSLAEPRLVSLRLLARFHLPSISNKIEIRMHLEVVAQNMLGIELTHCSLQSRYDLLIQLLALLLDYRNMSTTVITHWKKSEHICRSPPLRFRQRMLLSAASWHGSKYSLYALLCLVSAYSKWKWQCVARAGILFKLCGSRASPLLGGFSGVFIGHCECSDDSRAGVGET
jgi:hypothetical protein